MKNFDLENVNCHAALGMIEKRWGFPRRTLRALLGMTENAQFGRSLLAESGADALQSGRSMIEMLGVLAIIGVLSVGGIAGYSKAMMKYRINKTIEQITLIAGNVRSFFAPQRNYKGLEGGVNNIILKAKLVPDEMIVEDDMGHYNLLNPFGGVIYLEKENRSSSEVDKAFRISNQISDDEACIELVSQDWANAGVVAVRLTDSNRDYIYLKTPATVDDAVKYCDDRYAPEINFYFEIDASAEPWKTRLQ